MDADHAALIGRRLGEFVIREPLSTGGFGQVFRAEQPALAREAVIKVLHRRLRASETVTQRFLREARLASRLDHPFAAHVYAFGVEPDGLRWLAMELVRGTPLDALLAAKGPIALDQFVPLLERLCQVVQTAHEQGIVHRDLKPANVMVLVRAGQLLPKLLDLGIAKLGDADDAPTQLTDGETSRLTEDGAVIGSPHYMAPEQWLDAGAADARADIYALGVLCYEALTGAPPFRAARRLELARAHGASPVPPLGRGLPAALDEVIARAMAKDPADRFESALALARAFRTASGISDEPVDLPRLDEETRARAMARAPRPIAQAVAALDGARNPHQARDAIWQLVRVATRWLGAIALAAHGHVGAGGAPVGALDEALRRLRARATPDRDWLELTRALTAPFLPLRAAYPVPELVDFVEQHGRGAAALPTLLAMRDDDRATDAVEVRAVVARALPQVEALLADLDFLCAYPLVRAGDSGVLRWMGVGPPAPVRDPGRAAGLPHDQPALLDARGAPAVTLWPYVQIHEPAPGVSPAVFVLEGKGRRGARLVALPATFEHDDDDLWDVIGGLVHDAASARDASQEERCPFPGLAAFTIDDAARFVGREREAEAVANRLRAQPLVAVVGPSGAGKSSFVQAGVLPALPPEWQAIVVRPGAAPLANLAARTGISRAALDAPDGLATALAGRPQPTVLVIDQLEELFTLCPDPGERDAFLEAIGRAARTADDPVRVILTLRDDFLVQAEQRPALRTRLAPALHLLTTPTRDDLLRILRTPLAELGYELDDPALADEMVDALAGARSPLALLSFTGARLWDLRDRRFRQLTRRAYQSLGGVGGALAQHAETTLAAMAPEHQRLTREVFRHAVTADGTRAVMRRGDLEQVLGGGAAAPAVIEALVGSRLLVTADAPDGGEQVEITHEALIDAWPRLVGWRREDAAGARLRDQLRAAARQWDERGRSPGLLWRGDALAEYRLWRARQAGALAPLEQAFADASIDDERRGRRRRTRALAAAFATLAVGVVALVVLNTRVASQRSRAETSAVAAQRAADDLRATLRAQYEDQGRRLVLAGDDAQGLAYLLRAAEMGARGPAHELLIASAARALDSRVVQLAQGDEATDAAFSPDGKWLATVGHDGRARIWDTRTWHVAHDLRHDAPLWRVAIAGDTLVTSTDAGQVISWDLATGAQRRVLRTGGAAVRGIAIAADAHVIATVADDDVVELWDPATGARLAPLQPEAHALTKPHWGVAIAMTPDGRRVVAGDMLGAVRIWDVATRRLIATNHDHTDLIFGVAITADGARVAAASGDSSASLIDAASGRRIARLPHEQVVIDAAFSGDGALVATGANDGVARLWDARTGAALRTLRGHTAGVNRVRFRADGRQLATCSDDRTAALWDVATGRREAQLTGHDDALLALGYAPDGERLVTAGTDQTAIVWRTRAQQPAVALIGHRDVVRTGAFSPDGALVATAGMDGTTRVWQRASGRLLHTLPQAGFVLRSVFSPDGSHLATVGDDAVVHLWSTASWTEDRALRGHARRINDVAWSHDGTWLATASLDGTARIWPLAAGAAPRVFDRHQNPVTSIDVAPDDGRVVTAATNRELRVWRPTDVSEVTSWTESKGAYNAKFDPRGERVLASTAAASARIYDPRGAFMLELIGHASSVLSTAWSPRGEHVVTAGIDGTARIWDAARGDELLVLRAPPGVSIWTAAFAPDGGAVITTGSDGFAMIWEMPTAPPDLAALSACAVPYGWRGDRMVHVDLPASCVHRD